MSELKPPSKRTVKLAKKVLASRGNAPAHLYHGETGWTLQWHELSALAKAALAAAQP